MQDHEFLTVAQAAGRLQVHEDTVRAAVRRGDLVAVRIGRAVRIPAAALAKLEREAHCEPALTSR